MRLYYRRLGVKNICILSLKRSLIYLLFNIYFYLFILFFWLRFHGCFLIRNPFVFFPFKCFFFAMSVEFWRSVPPSTHSTRWTSDTLRTYFRTAVRNPYRVLTTSLSPLLQGSAPFRMSAPVIEIDQNIF